jgi:L-2-hydroxyglutarate oxidase LhgO
LFLGERRMERIDCVVVGAGVVGLAVARALANAGREVLVLEAMNAIGTGTSSRNSEVVHAGIYYPAESLKARTCVAGKHALYAYLHANGIPHRRCGKLIVATNPTQVAQLEKIKVQAAINGVEDLQWLDQGQVASLEPALRCEAALLSPSTGIVDSHAYMLSLQGDAERAGAVFAFRSAVTGGRISADGIQLLIGGEEWLAATLVNCAGLSAPAVAASLTGLDSRFIPRQFYAKGNYFSYTGRCDFSHLIYPVPEEGGLGVHLTLDLAGRPRFGPDVEWIEALDYTVNPVRGDRFYDAIRQYWPALPNGSLRSDYAGIRPKLSGPGMPFEDFRIDGPGVHGISGLINLFGIESPGLTASLALADYVREILAAG